MFSIRDSLGWTVNRREIDVNLDIFWHETLKLAVGWLIPHRICSRSVTGAKRAVIASEAKQSLPFNVEIASSFHSSQ